MANEVKWADPSDDHNFWQQINLRRVDKKCGCMMADGEPPGEFLLSAV